MEEVYYLVKYNGNYADEFDVYFHSVMSESELKEAKSLIRKVDWVEEEFYFGTNEYIEVNSVDLLKVLDSAVEITPEQHQVLIDLDINIVSFGDGLNWDGLLDCAYDQINNE